MLPGLRWKAYKESGPFFWIEVVGGLFGEIEMDGTVCFVARSCQRCFKSAWERLRKILWKFASLNIYLYIYNCVTNA
jgi:hypothetical protein